VSIRKASPESSSQRSALLKRPRAGLLFHIGAGTLLVVIMVCVALYVFAG
jgi:hypothetical protein